MSNSPQQAAVFTIAGNGAAEVVPISAIRKLLVTATQRMLFVTNEHGQPEAYLLDTQAFEAEYVEEYGKHENDDVHRAYIAAAIHRAIVVEGKTFTISARLTAEKREAAAA